MRVVRTVVVAGLAGPVLALTGALPASAAPPLRWQSPATITSDVPFTVASISPCPPDPIAGDVSMAEVFVAFPQGGGIGDALTLDPDGSWSGQLTFSFSNAPREATFSASCVDVTLGGQPYAQYQTHHVVLFG